MVAASRCDWACLFHSLGSVQNPDSSLRYRGPGLSDAKGLKPSQVGIGFPAVADEIRVALADAPVGQQIHPDFRHLAVLRDPQSNHVQRLPSHDLGRFPVAVLPWNDGRDFVRRISSVGRKAA